MRYRTIVADPPWDHSDGTGFGTGRGFGRNFVAGDQRTTAMPYPSMTVAEIALRSLVPFLRVKRHQAIVVLGLRDIQAYERLHRTKVVGERQFPNAYGTVRTIPNLAHSDEYVAICHGYYEQCRELNRRGVN